MSIGTQFQPRQPSIDYEEKKFVSYRELSPEHNLREHIYCYWQLKTTRKLEEPFVYRVVSDGCIDILFETSSIERIFITGFSTSFLEYELGQEFNYMGIRFLPTGLPLMFNVPASEFTNQFLELSLCLPEVYSGISQVLSADNNLNQFKQVLDLYFAGVLEKDEVVKPDDRVLNAMNVIMNAGGNIDIKSLDIGLSERQLRRLFQFYYGESPKTFCQVVRFQNILRSKPSIESLKRNKIFYNLGYYDQAHFIKEFKNFYGVTPSRAFGRS